MVEEQVKIKKSLINLFPSAHDIFVDTELQECSVQISVDEFIDNLSERLLNDNIFFTVVDFNDTYPYKYVFEYRYDT